MCQTRFFSLIVNNQVLSEWLKQDSFGGDYWWWEKSLDGHSINLISSSVILSFHHRSSSPYLRTLTSAMGITSFLSGNQHSLLRIHISYKCKHKVSSTFENISVPLFDESLQWLQYRLCIRVHSQTYPNHGCFTEVKAIN